jgi:hypothetical protein
MRVGLRLTAKVATNAQGSPCARGEPVSGYLCTFSRSEGASGPAFPVRRLEVLLEGAAGIEQAAELEVAGRYVFTLGDWIVDAERDVLGRVVARRAPMPPDASAEELVQGIESRRYDYACPSDDHDLRDLRFEELFEHARCISVGQAARVLALRIGHCVDGQDTERQDGRSGRWVIRRAPDVVRGDHVVAHARVDAAADTEPAPAPAPHEGDEAPTPPEQPHAGELAS